MNLIFDIFILQKSKEKNYSNSLFPSQKTTMAILSLRSTATARLLVNMSILTTSIITFLSFYCSYCDALAGSSGSGSSGSSFRFKLTPDTSPIEIIEQQLVALQNDNIDDVYKYASPINKAGIGNNIQIFNQIVRSYPYR